MTSERKASSDIQFHPWVGELAAWAPPASSDQAQIDRRPAERFASLLDVDLAARQGLPPLWVWFYFTDIWRQSNLGPDGHPVSAPFYPPIWPRARMFAGGRLTVHRNLAFGEEVTRQSELVRAEVKAGRTGPLAFVTVRHRYLDACGESALEEEQDHVYRTTSPGEGPRPAVSHDAYPVSPAAPLQVPELDRGRGELAFDPDPVALFLFSAITHNAHRIHYDLAYATATEGYPGLVVHGPLLALLMLEVHRRDGGEAFTGTFAYRLRQPAFAGQRLLVLRSADGPLVKRPADGAVVATSILSETRSDDA